MSEYAIGTTPFGRRSLTLAHVASQAVAKARPPEKAVHKWQVFRAICTARARVGASERALAVLDALLSFHPETTLIGEGLIVFPSNQQLALRAHGMAPATLRRHLAALVDCGLIIRRDSPNGKRFARKGQGGAIEMAFGFDLSPLVARAEEFEAWAEEVRAEERALRLVRERITLCRRDIAKMIATGTEEGVPTRRSGQGPADWAEVHRLYRGIIERLPRSAVREELEPVAEELTLLADEILNLLESHIKSQKTSVNEFKLSATYKIQTQTTPLNLNQASEKARGRTLSHHLNPRDLHNKPILLEWSSRPARTLPTTPRAVFRTGAISLASRRSSARCSESAPAPGRLRKSQWANFPPRSSSRRSCRGARRLRAPAGTCANSPEKPRSANSRSDRC